MAKVVANVMDNFHKYTLLESVIKIFPVPFDFQPEISIPLARWIVLKHPS